MNKYTGWLYKGIDLHPRYKSALKSGLMGTALSLLLSVVVARVLSVEERGVFQYVITSITILMAVLSFGVPFSNSHFEIQKKRLLPDVIVFPTLLLGVALCFLVGGSSKGLDWLLLLVFSFSYASSLYLIDRYKNPKRLKLYSWMMVIQPSLCLALVGVGLLFEVSLTLILWAYSGAYILGSLVLLKCDDFSIFRQNKLSIKGVDYGYMFSYWAATLSSVLVNNIDKIFILAYLSIYELGLFSVIQGLSSFIGRIGERIAVTTYVNNMEVESKKPGLLLFVKLAALLLPLFLAGYLIGLYLVPFIYTAKYAGLEIYCGLMFCSTFIGSVAWNFAQQVIVDGKPRLNIYRNFLSLLVFIAVIQGGVSTDALQNVIMAVLVSAIFRLLYSIAYMYLRKPNYA